MNLDRPPFQVIPGRSAEEAAEAIVETFLLIDALPDKVSRVFKTISECLEMSDANPLAIAGNRLAKRIDADSPVLDNPYHNSQHTCEVMLSAYHMGLLSGLDTRKNAEVVLAALIHDFHHDGKHNGDIPFRLERLAVTMAEPYLSEAGITIAEQRLIAALILATNTTIGLPVAHACHTHHTQGTPLPKIPIFATELAELSKDPTAALQALVLCDADILPSIGLTIDYALKLQEKLSKEWHTPLGLEDKLHFIEYQRHTFVINDFFCPNIDTLKFELLNRLQKH